MNHLVDIIKLLSLLGVQNALVAFGPALVNFINGLPAAGTDPIKLGLLWLGLKGDIAKAAPSAMSSFETQLDTFFIAKIAGIEASVAAAIAALQPQVLTTNQGQPLQSAQGPAAALGH